MVFKKIVSITISFVALNTCCMQKAKIAIVQAQPFNPVSYTSCQPIRQTQVAPALPNSLQHKISVRSFALHPSQAIGVKEHALDSVQCKIEQTPTIKASQNPTNEVQIPSLDSLHCKRDGQHITRSSQNQSSVAQPRSLDSLQYKMGRQHGTREPQSQSQAIVQTDSLASSSNQKIDQAQPTYTPAYTASVRANQRENTSTSSKNLSCKDSKSDQSVKQVDAIQKAKPVSVWTSKPFDYLPGRFNPLAWIHPAPSEAMWQKSFDTKEFIKKNIESGILLEYVLGDRCKSYEALYGKNHYNIDFSEKGKMKADETQQIYESLLRMQVELKQFERLLCKCGAPIEHADHFQKMLWEVSNNIRWLEQTTKSIETLKQLEHISLSRMSEQMENEKTRPRGPRSLTTDDIIKLIGRSLGGSVLNVGAGVNWGAGKPTDLTLQAGPLSKTFSFGDNDESDKQSLAATRARAEELAAAEAKKEAAKAPQLSASQSEPIAKAQKVQQKTEPIQPYESKLFDDNKKELISFSNYFAEKGKEDKAKQLSECAEFWGQKSQELRSSKTSTVVNNDILISLHPLVQESAKTTDPIKQEFLFDAITTTTQGSIIVEALEKSGQHQAAEFVKTAIKNELGQIQENLLPNPNAAPTSARVEHERLSALDQELKAKTDHLVEMIMRGDAADCLKITGKSAEEQFRILRGAVRGVGEGIVCVADPRNLVKGTEQLIKAGCCVVEQLGRLEAYQEAIECGDLALAQKFEADFKSANTEVVRAATQWYETFKQLPAEEQARIIASFGTTLVLAKPATMLQLKILGASLGGVSAIAGKIGEAIKAEESAVAMTPEGIAIPLEELEAAEAAIETGQNLSDIKLATAETTLKNGHSRNFTEIDAKYTLLKKIRAEIDSIRGLIKRENLPTKGEVRYLPLKNLRIGDGLPTEKLPGGRVAFIDRFGNKWVKGVPRTPGQPKEWDVQLSEAGKRAYGSRTRDNTHLNVSYDGRITHK